MKIITNLLLLLGLFLTHTTFGQQDTVIIGQEYKKKEHNAWLITDINRKRVVSKGRLRECRDSSILFSTAGKSGISQEIAIRNIESLKFRRKGNIGKGFLIGFAAGGTAGFLVGMVATSNQGVGMEGFRGAVIAVPSAIGCGLLGMVIGSAQKKIRINRNQKTYEKEKERLKTFTFL